MGLLRTYRSVCAVAPFIASIFLLSGCGGLRLQRPVVVQENDWPTFARAGTHTDATEESLAVPLKQDWELDIAAGMGTGTPIVVNGTLFVGTLRGELYAFQTTDGKRIGWTSLADAIPGSPIINGVIAVVTASNTRESLIGYDLLEGKVRWRKPYGDIEVSPLHIEEHIYFGNTRGAFFCVDRISGEQIWQFELPNNTRLKGIRSSPAGADSIIYFGSDDGAVYALEASTGKLRWSTITGGAVIAAPALANGTVYAANLDGTVIALNADSGTVRWRFSAGSPVYANVTPVENLVVFGTTGGVLYALRAADGSVAWKTDLGSPVNSGAVVARQTIFVGTLKKFLFALRLSDGSVTWKTEVNGRIKTAPIIFGGRLYLATDERNIIAFRGTGL